MPKCDYCNEEDAYSYSVDLHVRICTKDECNEKYYKEERETFFKSS